MTFVGYFHRYGELNDFEGTPSLFVGLGQKHQLWFCVRIVVSISRWHSLAEFDLVVPENFIGCPVSTGQDSTIETLWHMSKEVNIPTWFSFLFWPFLATTILLLFCMQIGMVQVAFFFPRIQRRPCGNRGMHWLECQKLWIAESDIHFMNIMHRPGCNLWDDLVSCWYVGDLKQDRQITSFACWMMISSPFSIVFHDAIPNRWMFLYGQATPFLRSWTCWPSRSESLSLRSHNFAHVFQTYNDH